MAKKNKVNSFSFSEKDIALIGFCNKEFKVAFSIEKCFSGFNIVKYELNDNLEGLKKTIKYKRLDLTKKDSVSNRLLLGNQFDAEKEMLSCYTEVFNYLKN
jgi:hypothetical protein